MLRNVDFFTRACISASKTSQQRHKRQHVLSVVVCHRNHHLCTDKLALNKERVHVLYLLAIECYFVDSVIKPQQSCLRLKNTFQTKQIYLEKIIRFLNRDKHPESGKRTLIPFRENENGQRTG